MQPTAYNQLIFEKAPFEAGCAVINLKPCQPNRDNTQASKKSIDNSSKFEISHVTTDISRWIFNKSLDSHHAELPVHRLASSCLRSEIIISSHEFHLIWKIFKFSSSYLFGFGLNMIFFFGVLRCAATLSAQQHSPTIFDTALNSPFHSKFSSHFAVACVWIYLLLIFVESPDEHETKKKHKLVIYEDSKYNFHLFFLYFFLLFTEAQIIACRSAGQQGP